MLRIVLLATVMFSCSTSGGDDAPLDPTSCPAAPFEQCGYRDGGWDVYCDAGVIYEVSHNGALYCAPGKTEVVCDDVDVTPRVRQQCPVAACTPNPAMQSKYLETVDEYDKFDPMSLCAWP